jgi:hypothetical protein
MKENFTLVLNSTAITTNKTGNNTNLGYTYNVNWENILPDRNTKYKVNFTFFSMSKSGFTDVYSLYINFGTADVYDNNSSRTTFLGDIHPYSLTTTVFYAVANLNDNQDITISYPSNRFITVSLININSGQPTVYLSSEYILTLSFTPIE